LRVPNALAHNLFHALYRNVRRVWLLRRCIRQSGPDLVISFLDFPNVVTLLATRGLGVPVIVSERANPAFDDLKTTWTLMRRLLYPRAAALVCQTSAMVTLLQQKIKVARYAIPNAVELPAANAGAAKGDDTNARTAVAMGRLVPQKGFDLLLE